MITNLMTGVSTGDFDTLKIRNATGQMVDILSLLGGGGGGGSGIVSSAVLPLSISNGALSINLSAYSDTVAMGIAIAAAVAGYIQTTHEANKVGAADVAFGAYDVGCKTVSLTNGSGVSATLSVGNSGDISIGADGILTVPMLNAWHFLSMSFQDSLGVQRTLTPLVNGGLAYNASQLVDLNMLATKQNVLTASAGIFLAGANISSYSLRWNSSNTPSLPTAIQELHWDGYTVAETVNLATNKIELTIGHPNGMATQTQLATKQNSLAYYSESVGTPTYYMYSNETANPPLYMAWASGTYSNQTGYQSITLMIYHSLSSLPVTGHMLFTMELQAGTAAEVVLSTNDASWSNWGETKFSGLNNTWQAFSWQSNLYANGFMNFHMGLLAPGSQYTQAAGDIKLRNLRMYTSSASYATISSDLSVQHNISCVSLTQTSDESIKENITHASLDELQSVFDSVEVKQYNRTDVPGNRIGFIAQDIKSAISADSKMQNIVNPIYSVKPAPPLLGLDYARLASTVLWGVCKKQQALIADLDARLKVLETNKKKSASKKM